MGSPNEDEQHARFSRRALQRIHDATFDDLVSFLRVSDVAKGSQHTHFEKAFPRKEGGLLALVHKLKVNAAATQDHTNQLDGDLVRLVSQIQAQSDTLPAEVRAIATREFMRYYQALEEDPDAQVRALMIAVARFDPEAAELIAARYRITDSLYAERYKALLATLNREPIEPLADYHDFAVTIASMLNGLLIRANIEQDPKHSRDLFESVIVRFIGAITHPVGSEPLTEEECLLGDSKASATKAILRTPADATYVEDVSDLVGTWQGTQFMDSTTHRLREPHRPAYLVIESVNGVLEITQYVSTARCRMMTPQFVATTGGRRLSCVYEVDRTDNATPDFPSHRGAWVLEASTSPTSLAATYFNDRGGRGRFSYTHHSRETATGFISASNLFPPWQSPVEHAG